MCVCRKCKNTTAEQRGENCIVSRLEYKLVFCTIPEIDESMKKVELGMGTTENKKSPAYKLQ
jgi:hypothetical protein